MPMQLILSVRLCGEMPQAKLDALRGRMGMRSIGRLTDLEDAEFGYRYLRQDKGNFVVLHLWRRSDTEWAIHLSFENEPPSDTIVQQYRSQIFEAAAALGLTAEEA